MKPRLGQWIDQQQHHNDTAHILDAVNYAEDADDADDADHVIVAVPAAVVVIP